MFDSLFRAVSVATPEFSLAVGFDGAALFVALAAVALPEGSGLDGSAARRFDVARVCSASGAAADLAAMPAPVEESDAGLAGACMESAGAGSGACALIMGPFAEPVFGITGAGFAAPAVVGETSDAGCRSR